MSIEGEPEVPCAPEFPNCEALKIGEDGQVVWDPKECAGRMRIGACSSPATADAEPGEPRQGVEPIDYN